ncbi:HotDog domain-containing protein [Talaromyces proteolyticus]|uniref:HotDog domain-containing protein n=1 Tax=Talaromyces proteolyticus TaxID=1131652 RepID=A0AAD4L0L5_9EURO|nr:HotDog domain-containing protein [Talaromyces proteolyticus]KAH8704033.1 HotDog domain-containing protein [Talaromyces proteolyticus]
MVDGRDNCPTKQDVVDGIECFLELYKQIIAEKSFKGYDVKLLTESIKFVDADPSGWSVWEFTADETWCNINGVLHGGAYALIFDMCTALTMQTVSKAGYWDFLGGVSRTLNISYLKGIPLGTKVCIRCQVEQHGRTMALLSGYFESLDGKTKYATVEHHKVHVPSIPEYAARLEAMKNVRRRERLKL